MFTNQSSSACLTGVEEVKGFNEHFDVQHNTLSSSELMSSEEEMEKEKSEYTPWRSAESDPLWSSTMGSNKEGDNVTVQCEEEPDMWEERHQEECHSVEGIL